MESREVNDSAGAVSGRQGGVRISDRARAIKPFIVMEVLERAFQLERQGRSIVHMEVGEPDFETPEVIREAGIKAIREGRTHYTHSLGHPELREAIAAWQKRQYGISISPDSIIITSGSSGAMLLIFGALLNPEEKVLIPDPGYPCYSKLIRSFEGTSVGIEVVEEDGFHFDPERVRKEIDSLTRAVLINSPSNPAGTLMTADQMIELTRAVEGKCLVVSDEIYHGLVYGDRAHSILEFTSEAVVINGFSKLFAMTGWRLGYAILPTELVRPVQKLQQNLFISAADFVQLAAIAALEKGGDAVETMRTQYDLRRRFVLERLDAMGLGVSRKPTGAFYVFVNVSAYTENVYDFAFEILEKAGVAVTPGIDFGIFGEGYIRLCYANSMENLAEGMTRLAAFFAERQ